ncbi:interferon-induced protein 75-like [Microtus ochrogaster]|uniref:Interferon-induced protein 75-like n=1 Tax=Microtus ochrogaster TaxID=79684 RepID=A0ABM1UJW7_MICOH|nr:interferon-induced protein 75-like [Microtus ochrogaster]
MFTMTKAIEDVLLQHFIQTKLDIAYAINKPFPFFEALRDHCFITEKIYKDSLDACRNLVPVSRVVHNVLTSLERTFHPSLLLTLFSQVNLREYPSLGEVFRSFKNVVTAYERNKRSAQTLPKAPAVLAEGRSFQTLLPLPPPQPSPPSHPSSASRVGEPRAASQQITEILDEQPSPSPPAVPPAAFVQEGKTTPAASNNLTTTTDEEADSERTSSTSSGTGQASSVDPQRNDKDDSPEMPHSRPGPIPVIKGNLTSKVKEEEASGGQPPRSPGAVQVAKNDSPAPNDLEMAQEAPSAPAKQKKDSPVLNDLEMAQEAPDDLEMAQEAPSYPAKQKGDSPAPDDLGMAQEAPSASTKQKKDSLVLNDLGMAQEATSTSAKKKAKKRKRDIWSTPKRRRQKKRPTQGVASPGQGVQKKLKVVDQKTQRKNDSTRNLRMVTRAQKARIGRSDIQSTG